MDGFQVATAADFVTAVETILDRKVRSFASGVDPDSNVVFESFWFAPGDSSSDGHGTLPAERAAELHEQPRAAT